MADSSATQSERAARCGFLFSRGAKQVDEVLVQLKPDRVVAVAVWSDYDPAERKLDFLQGIPDFSLHTVRSAATNFFSKYIGLQPAAASAFLGHGHKADKNDPNAMSEVTEKFYLDTQNMPLKIRAMQAWSEAVMEAYEKAGGRWPKPYPPPKPKIVSTTK